MLRIENFGIILANIIIVIITLIIGSEVIHLNIIPFGQFIIYGLIVMKLLLLIVEALESSRFI